MSADPVDSAATAERYDFALDRFQLDAIESIDAGAHTLVAAPTGSGKTVVAEHGIDRALERGRRAFYTAPIKALSNQKFHDLTSFYGESRVGLLTGDNAINADASIVVMTTEVLRNMIYAGRSLDDLGLVVIDEVHFLQDAYRGPVWEEVIIHLPAHVQLVCLSATVSNADELAEWIETVRGPSRAIVESRRPIQLDNMYMVTERDQDRVRIFPTIVNGEPNRSVERLEMSAHRQHRKSPARRRASRLATPSRLDVVELLDEQRLLPAIFFIFSRNQCNEAARQAAAAGLRFTNLEQRERIGSLLEQRLGGLSNDDLAALDYDDFVDQLMAGVAAHHAGMVPPFKEIVEQCFLDGLIKVVFATETLAVGVNMPARTVVIDKLTKYTGDHHESLSPAQYTQLTGRAGRRGLDSEGTAVVLWSPFVRFDQVVELAQSRSFYLRSAFRPTYNMAANLMRSYDETVARQLLSLSFAQFQADREIVKFERRLQRERTRLADLMARAESPYGDIVEYRNSASGPASGGTVEFALESLRPGELIHVSKGKTHGPVAVVATARRKSGVKVTAITPGAHVLQLSAADFDSAPSRLGRVVLPGAYSPHQRSYRDEVGARIKQATLGTRRRGASKSAAANTSAAGEPSIDAPEHPVLADPDLQMRLGLLDEADRVRTTIDGLERKASSRDGTLNRDFDQVLTVLDELGYARRNEWELTDAGAMLARIFHESDLLICEAIRRGLFDGLDAPSMAGLVSAFIYEHRSPDDPPPVWFPTGEVRRRWTRLDDVSAELAAIERNHHLAEHRRPDPTFFPVAYAWVAGQPFADLVDDDHVAGGDVVRIVRQLIDLLDQLSRVAPNADTRRVAAAASEAANRGVIIDSTSIEGPI